MQETSHWLHLLEGHTNCRMFVGPRLHLRTYSIAAAKGPIVVRFENLKVAGVAWGCPILRLPYRPGCFTCPSCAGRQRMRIKDNQKPSRNSTHVPPVEALNRPAHAHACVHDNSRPCHLWPVNHGREGTLSNDSIPARSSRHPHAMFGEGDAPIPKERRGA
jgi:hypothetical protein